MKKTFFLKAPLKLLLGPFSKGRRYTSTKLTASLKKAFQNKNYTVTEHDLGEPGEQLPIKLFSITASNENAPLLQDNIFFSSPAKDTDDISLGFGATALSTLLTRLNSKNRLAHNTTFIIPLAQVLEKRKHWTLLLIEIDDQGKKRATLIDPKYATPGGYEKFCPKWLNRSQYPYNTILETLKPYDIDTLTVRFIGKQSFMNQWKCGPKVVELSIEKVCPKRKKGRFFGKKKTQEKIVTTLGDMPLEKIHH